MKLHAVFNMPEGRLKYFAKEAEKDACAPYDFEFEKVSPTRSIVSGRPQGVMFLIGKCADNGEDSLTGVTLL